MMTLPNQLTLLRLFIVPLIIFAFYLPFPTSNWIALILFVTASVTDFLDGYLARRLDQPSDLGALFDPIADKVLVLTTLFMLTSIGTISGLSIVAAMGIFSLADPSEFLYWQF